MGWMFHGHFAKQNLLVFLDNALPSDYFQTCSQSLLSHKVKISHPELKSQQTAGTTDTCTPAKKCMSITYYLRALADRYLAFKHQLAENVKKNYVPDKESLLRNLVCWNLFMIGHITALSKPGVGWKITTWTEPWTLLPEGTEGLRAGEKIRYFSWEVLELDYVWVASTAVPPCHWRCRK